MPRTPEVSRRALLRTVALGATALGTIVSPILFDATAAEASTAFVPADQDLHLLRRTTYGATPSTLAEIRRSGASAWLGRQLISGGSGNDTILGGGGRDAASGGSGNDRIEGGDGNDFLLGSQGNDLILGDLGRDTCNGGPGHDVVDCETESSLIIITSTGPVPVVGFELRQLATASSTRGQRRSLTTR